MERQNKVPLCSQIILNPKKTMSSESPLERAGEAGGKEGFVKRYSWTLVPS